MNDAKNAAPCAASYMLFDPKDQVMQQNVQYYRFYREQWGLEESDFQPRPVSHVHVCCLSGCFLMITLLCSDATADVTCVPQEALAYFNVTTKQREMLEFAQNYLQTDDEVHPSRRSR